MILLNKENKEYLYDKLLDYYISLHRLDIVVGS